MGAGPSGLVTAAVLTQFGHEVTVLEKAPDLGGVWSSTRRYPDVSTQDDRVSYAFSDVPMPADFPLHPTGNHVRAYLEHYAEVKGVRERIRLGTSVERAVPAGDGWSVQVRDAQGTSVLDVDWLVLANGVFSTPTCRTGRDATCSTPPVGRSSNPPSSGTVPSSQGAMSSSWAGARRRATSPSPPRGRRARRPWWRGQSGGRSRSASSAP